MKKWIASVSLVTLIINSPAYSTTCLSGNRNSRQVGTEIEFQTNLVQKSSLNIPYAMETGYLKVRPMQVTGFNPSAQSKLNQAFEILEKVVNSEEFKNKILSRRPFTTNRGFSNEQIYGIFMSGKETLQPDTMGEMNFFLKLYYSNNRTVGWTNSGINTININSKFFNRYTPSDVAGNLAHEWVHKIGFDHRSASDVNSAPYAIGYLVSDLGERILKGETLP